MGKTDFIEEVVRERTAANPEFPALVEAALRRRELLRSLAAEREERGLSQTSVAAQMNTSQSAVARLESGQSDARLSTVERMAAALGLAIEWKLVRPSRRDARPRGGAGRA